MQQSVLKIPVEIECRGCIMLDEVSVFLISSLRKPKFPRKTALFCNPQSFSWVAFLSGHTNAGELKIFTRRSLFQAHKLCSLSFVLYGSHLPWWWELDNLCPGFANIPASHFSWLSHEQPTDYNMYWYLCSLFFMIHIKVQTKYIKESCDTVRG